MNDFSSIASIELAHLNYPPSPWVVPTLNACDVAIIGGGMAGLTAAFALYRQGIFNIQIFDETDKGFEGPWATYARMPILRSGKDLVGPAMDLPALTFRAWFEVQFGRDKWQSLYKIPTLEWMRYLESFRSVLEIPVQNNQKVTSIDWDKSHFQLTVNEKKITAGKVVLATGRKGFGGAVLPDFIKDLPAALYAHTAESIDFNQLSGKRVGIVGAGASGFDAAAVALENGAGQVSILMRRPHIPDINKAASIVYSGFSEGYYALSDQRRLSLMKECYCNGVPPPFEALDRVNPYSQFSVKKGLEINSCKAVGENVLLETNQGLLEYDFLILATGFAFDGSCQPELRSFFSDVMLWKDKYNVSSRFGNSPYLGTHFQFIEKPGRSLSYLKHIYCFNYAATLSHGLLSSDIPGIGIGAARLARGIASDLFNDGFEEYYDRLKNYNIKEISDDNYQFLNNLF